MKNKDQTIDRLAALYDRLVDQRRLRKGRSWRGEWAEWVRGETWHPEQCGVYVLWGGDHDLEEGIPPIYVGQGKLGYRLWASFCFRPDWNFAQMLPDHLISENDEECAAFRKLLERLAILVLEPVENKD